MIIAIPHESSSGETRVAATPQTVGKIVKLGYSVVVESGAAAAPSFDADAYVAARRLAWNPQRVVWDCPEFS